MRTETPATLAKPLEGPGTLACIRDIHPDEALSCIERHGVVDRAVS